MIIMNENELRQLLKSDPDRGQRAFYDKYFNYIYTIVFSYLKNCGSIEDIDECVGDVFAECFLYFDKQETIEGNMKAFAASIARCKAVDTYRRLVRHSGNISIEECEEELRSDDDVVAVSEMSELRQILYSKVKELGEPDSTIIIQKYYYGRNSREISEIVAISADVVRARCSRAMKKLRGLLEKAGVSR
ncbi:RNA polymerase sigma-70 factor, ECF subfamily [Ruminococcus flavefaciens]|uniref:RNA polymerase sigma-70 factor, ECF subfamily n=2 Tax=Oscillospiraceae TaxID=216572 RepID=A0A1M7KME9_RUMFL|nr:RNA polymerase sigma-70 factor, ECF subfamily [Ruminococcus flavefaciens]